MSDELAAGVRVMVTDDTDPGPPDRFEGTLAEPLYFDTGWYVRLDSGELTGPWDDDELTSLEATE